VSRFSLNRRSQRRARSLSSASDLAAAASFTVESLELRRMLSAASSYDVQAHLVQQPTESDHGGFGSTVATNGSLALIGAPGVGVSFDYQGNPVVGGARLVDTSTGQTLRVFDDPGAQTSGDAFGQAVTFVNGKSAIVQGQNYSGGVGKVYVYDDANDLTPTICTTPTILNNGSSFGTNMVSVGNDLYVTIAQYNGGPSQSAIVKYNSSVGGMPTATYFNPLTTGNDGFGAQLAVQGTNIYATAIGPNGPSIYKLDTLTGTITLFTDANGGDSNFGFTLAASPTSLYVTTGGNQVLQFDSSANVVNTLTPPPNSGSVFGGFGESLAVGDDILVVGNRDALEDVDNFIPGGEAYVYDLATGNYAATVLNPTPVNPYLNQDPAAGEVDQFSWAVAPLPGGKFLVTDPTDDTNEGTSPGGPYDTGSVYVYAPHVNTPTNQAPTASVSAPATAPENTTVTLDASGSTDPDGAADITLYEWDLNNDGKFDDATGVTVNFTQDLPGNYPVAVRVTDTANHQSVASTSVQFTDVAPTANAGGNQSVSEGSSLTLHGSGNNTSGDAITAYAWDLDNNGSFETSGQNVAFNTDLPGSYTVNLRVTDDDGQTATSSATVTISDVAPTANAGGNQSGITGQTLNFNGSGTTAPGDAITSYQWDFNYDGNPAHFDVDASGASTSHSYAAIGTYTAALRVTDDDGQTAIGTATVTINNTTPTAGAVNGPTAGVRQQSLSFTGSFTDPDANDPHDVSWNFGDGNVIAFHSSADAGALAPSHAFVANGTYNVVMTVRDSHGATSSSQLSVTISTTLMQGGTLYIGGTTGNDKVSFTKATGGVNANIQGSNAFYPVTGKVIVFGGAGDDSLQSNADVAVSFEIYGGAGKDTIKCGLGNDLMVGGDGNDQLTGNDGRDILIGGTGADAVTSNNGDDILIAGETSFDNDPVSLRAILAEWSSGRSYTERVNNIRNGTGSPTRANGNVFLQADVTVFDDAAVDTLTGNTGTDWFFANIDLGTKDKADVKAGEVVDDVDIVVL
jgi:PKD repeat protein